MLLAANSSSTFPLSTSQASTKDLLLQSKVYCCFHLRSTSRLGIAKAGRDRRASSYSSHHHLLIHSHSLTLTDRRQTLHPHFACSSTTHSSPSSSTFRHLITVRYVAELYLTATAHYTPLEPLQHKDTPARPTAFTCTCTLSYSTITSSVRVARPDKKAIKTTLFTKKLQDLGSE